MLIARRRYLGLRFLWCHTSRGESGIVRARATHLDADSSFACVCGKSGRRAREAYTPDSVSSASLPVLSPNLSTPTPALSSSVTNRFAIGVFSG